MTTTTGRPPRRPRDRKAQILVAAVECFHRSGYQATGMEDIAAAVGITAGALYRHFRSKRELLGQALLSSSERLMEAVQQPADLDSLVRAVFTFTLDHRSYAAVWWKETRHLTPEQQTEVRGRHAKLASDIAAALRASRPGVDPAAADLISWAVLALAASSSFHGTELPRPQFDELLRRLASALCQAEPGPAVCAEVPQTEAGSGLTPSSRREALLVAAIPLFAERGYQAVSMEEIGAAAGVSRLSVYHYFVGKGELLAAALHRESEMRWGALTRDLGLSATADDGLRKVLHTYAESTVRGKGVAELLRVGEVAHLAEAEREALHRSQVDYVAEWVALLTTCHPALGQNEARVVVHAALALLNMLPRLAVLENRADPVAIVVALSSAVLEAAADL
ncbi:TetR family transcriptional regulator [Streptomyces sp. NPDC005281]|uniref:TetR/AcrR family transcriptional regulator n=1 Tax=Streptomyces sp. NPDC005281 TaxID=3155712 RepID=UPI0033B124E4